MTVAVELAVTVDTPVQRTWDAATDWERQGEWMLGTTVRATALAGIGVGGRLEAFTGIGPFGVLDTMEIAAWDPPYRCEVLHTGRVVRGTGGFEVRDLGNERSAFVWREDLELPWGAVGRTGWPVVRPLLLAGVRRSLTRFARWVPIR